MNQRRDRVKLQGRTNFDMRSSVEFSQTNRDNKFDTLLAKRLTATIMDPISQTQKFYKDSNKTIAIHPQISRPRFAHLEEKERRKPVWVGDSYIVYEDHENKAQSKEKGEDKKNQMKDLVQAKRDTHGTATQETQLIGMEEYAKETLEGKVDVQKVKEIRRALRRRYGNRKNFQKIFTLWDEEGTGTISVRNIYHMVKKLGLNMNIDEVRVLIASADIDRSGDLNLDEFMNMIFNDNEAFSVNLKEMRVLDGDQEKNILEKDDQVEEMLRKRTDQQLETRHLNQLNLVLKNKIMELQNQFLNKDPLHQGYVNFEKFQEVLQKQHISDKILSTDDIKNLYNKFKRDEHTIDYKTFLKHLKEFELQSDYQQIEHPKKKTKPQFSIKLNPTDESDKVHVFDCHKINAHHLHNIREKANRMFRTLKRYLPEKQQFEEQLQLNKEYIHVTDLSNMLKNLLLNCGEKVDPRELGALLSIIQYNNQNAPCQKLSYYFYDEEDDVFYERCSQQKKGPHPQQQKLSTQEDVVQTETETKQTFYDSAFGLSSTSAKLPKPLADILQKVETAIFRASARQYEIFHNFDIDKDGYVSQQDFVQKIENMHILQKQEINTLINYLDPNQTGSLNFQEFSSKLFPGMTLNNPYGYQEVVPSLYPAKERLENMKSKLPSLRHKERSADDEGLHRATRFGATPIHKNTFLTIQRPPKDSALYQSEQDRFSKDYNSRIRYLRDEQEKEKQVYEQKLNRIRQHQNEIHEKIETNYQIQIKKDEDKYKTKGLQAWSYEQRAHLQNDWK